MIEPRAALLRLTFTAVLIPQVMGAQLTPKLEAGALTTGWQDTEMPATFFRVSPQAGYRVPFFSLSAFGSAWLRDEVWYLTEGAIAANLLSPIVYGVRAEMLGSASRALDVRSLVADQLDVQTRIHFLFRQNAGAWVGGGTARPWRVAVVSSIDVVNGGAWVTSGTATYSTTVTQYNITKESARAFEGGIPMCGSRALDPSQRELIFAVGNCREQTRVTDVEAAAKWEIMGVEYAAQAGYRFGDNADVSPESRQWATSSATKWITPRMAFALGGGRQPANPARGIPARTFGSLGMVLAFMPANRGVPVAADRKAIVQMFDVRPAGPGTHKITVRIGSVERVDVTGDFSNWEPVALTRRPGTDIWELRMQMEPGVHHINLRVDGGAWSVPPGLPTISDGFGGEVGLLVVSR